MHKKVRFSIWFSIVIIEAFAVGYLSWAKATFNWPFDNIIVDSIKHRSSPSSVAGWKTYRNEEYGFELKYPPDWKFEARNSNFRDGFFFSKGKSSLSIVPAGEFDYGPDGFRELPVKNDYFAGKRINVREWIQEEEPVIEEEPQKLIWYQFTEGIPNWETCCNRIDILANERDLEIINQTLSTFKFIEPTAQNTESSTYRDEYWGYEFKYPAKYVEIREGGALSFAEDKESPSKFSVSTFGNPNKLSLEKYHEDQQKRISNPSIFSFGIMPKMIRDQNGTRILLLKNIPGYIAHRDYVIVGYQKVVIEFSSETAYGMANEMTEIAKSVKFIK